MTTNEALYSYSTIAQTLAADDRNLAARSSHFGCKTPVKSKQRDTDLGVLPVPHAELYVAYRLIQGKFRAFHAFVKEPRRSNSAGHLVKVYHAGVSSRWFTITISS